MAVAVSLGWHTGARSDDTIYPIHRPLYQLDLNWKAVDWAKHLSVARAEHPALTVVPDILDPSQLSTVLAQAEEIAPFTDAVMIVPKCDVIAALPRSIGGKPVVLGYSVPSGYGGSNLPVWSYVGWPVHLLGGTPKRQLTCAHYLNVISADGNMCQKLANSLIAFDERGRGLHLDHWQPRSEREGKRDLPIQQLERSLVNIPIFWQRAGFTLERRAA